MKTTHHRIEAETGSRLGNPGGGEELCEQWDGITEVELVFDCEDIRHWLGWGECGLRQRPAGARWQCNYQAILRWAREIERDSRCGDGFNPSLLENIIQIKTRQVMAVATILR